MHPKFLHKGAAHVRNAQPANPAPRPYHVSERKPLRNTPCRHNCGHPKCEQECGLVQRRYAFMEGQ